MGFYAKDYRNDDKMYQIFSKGITVKPMRLCLKD